MSYEIYGSLISEDLLGMRDFLQDLVNNYSTNLRPAGNVKQKITSFRFEVPDIQTLISTINTLLSTYSTIEVNYQGVSGV